MHSESGPAQRPTISGGIIRMIPPAQLSLTANGWSLFASLLVVMVTASIGYFAWRQSGYSTTRGLQELLRLFIVGFVALLLNQPEWIEQYQPESKPTVLVLWDDSHSMQTQDASNLTTAGPITRSQAIEALKSESAWIGDAIENREVIIQAVGASQVAAGQEPSGTDLSEPLLKATINVDQLLAVVLMSDGDWNTGQPPVDAAARLKLKGVPLHTVAVGSPSRLPDIDLISIEPPTFGIVDKPVRIPLTIESSLPREFVTTIKLQVSNGETLTRDLRVAPMGRTNDSFSWSPKATGDYTLTVTVPEHADEAIFDNNAKSSPIAIRKERLKVLIVESFPRWEYRYLRNALSRDPGVEVACLLFQTGLEKVGGGSVDYIKVFPESIEELSEFDVVFLGDVGLELGQLTEEHCARLKGLVEHQASGLVFIPGIHGRQFELIETDIGELMPVVLDPVQPGGWGSRTPGHFELTARGRRSLLTRLADAENNADRRAGSNADVWENLPGFQWYAPVVRAKAGSDVLAVHREMTNEFGRLPLLATRTFGTGKVLFMGTDGAWRWRKGVEDKYHYRFWGQVVRWMAYQRNMAEGETMRFIYSPDQPKLDQVMTLRAHVMDDTGEPLQSGEVVVMIRSPAGETESVRLRSEGEDWGAFEGRFTPDQPGNHRVTVACQQTTATLETNFFVHGNQQEPIGKPARPDVLEELSRVAGGLSTSSQDVSTIVESLASLPDPPPIMRRSQLWSHPATAAFLVFLLGVFWIWRKLSGLF